VLQIIKKFCYLSDTNQFVSDTRNFYRIFYLYNFFCGRYFLNVKVLKNNTIYLVVFTSKNLIYAEFRSIRKSYKFHHVGTHVGKRSLSREMNGPQKFTRVMLETCWMPARMWRSCVEDKQSMKVSYMNNYKIVDCAKEFFDRPNW